MKHRLDLIDVANTLTMGIVAGKPIFKNMYTRKKVNHEKMSATDRLEYLESKYGSLNIGDSENKFLDKGSHKKLTSEINNFVDKELKTSVTSTTSSFGLQNVKSMTLADLKKLRQENKNVGIINNTTSHGEKLSDNIKSTDSSCDTETGMQQSGASPLDGVSDETESTASHSVKLSDAQELTDSSYDDIEQLSDNSADKRSDIQVSTEVTYQSAFLQRVMKICHPEYLQPDPDLAQEEERRRQEALVKEAERVARHRVSWPHFQHIFITSALDGSGINDLKVGFAFFMRSNIFKYCCVFF